MGKAPSPLDAWRAADAAEAEAVRAAAAGQRDDQTPENSEELVLDQPIADAERPSFDEDVVADIPPRAWGDFAAGAAVGLLAAGWVALIVLRAPAATSAVDLIALASGPLALLGIVYILARRTGTRDAKRFATTAMSMRAESERLEAAVARITATLDGRREALAAHTDSLLAEGTRAAERLQQISMDMRDETDLLARHSDQLSQAAAAARNDVGALLVDLPRAQEISGETARFMAEIGGSSRTHADALADALSTIIARSHEADELINAAAGRLATQIGRIETRSERAARAVEEAGGALARSVDGALEQIGGAIEQTRIGVDAQREAMGAMIDHARSTIDEAGSAAAQAIAGRMTALGLQADDFAAKIAAQDQASHRLIEGLDHALGLIEQRFESLGATSAEQTADLAEMIVSLSDHVENVGKALANSLGGARTLTDRAHALRIAFDTVLQNVERDLPATMQRMENETQRGDVSLRAITAQAEQLAATVERATDRLDSADLLIDRQRQAIAGLGDQATRRMANIAAEGDALLDRQRELSDSFAEEAAARLEALRDHSTELGRLIAQSEANMRSLAELSGERLVDALLRVRETAAEAARGAREALESIIPDASDRLARSGAEAIERAFGDQITARIHLISDTAEAAVAAANHASEKLLKQMLSIAEASAMMEKRVAEVEADRVAGRTEERADQPAQDDGEFARTASLLVEALNSSAIDVTKILSADVTDSAWGAYLRGDKGIFTRQAVRLLEAGEAQHIAAYYDREPAFRNDVNKYIRDFETMLRRILASRDGGPLGVTMLSSDMGKLYVALAQAIDRLKL
jgi:hypothetical protein